MELQIGQRIKVPFLPAPAEVKKFEARQGYFRLEVLLQDGSADGAFADICYIEVKARAQSGAISLSANEWKKAWLFGEKFWLYIVTVAGTDSPQLHWLQNPAAHFRLDEDIFATGFIIPEEK